MSCTLHKLKNWFNDFFDGNTSIHFLCQSQIKMKKLKKKKTEDKSNYITKYSKFLKNFNIPQVCIFTVTYL